MDLIQTPDTENTPTVLTPEAVQNPDWIAPVQPTAVVNHTANMLTLKDTNNTEDLDALNQNYNIAAQSASDGTEQQVRADLAVQQLREKTESLRELQKQSVLGGNIEDYNALNNLVSENLSENMVETQKLISLEQATTDKLQYTASTNPVQAKALTDEGEDGLNHMDKTSQRVTKYQLFAKAAQQFIQRSDEDQSTLGMVTDFAGSLIPLSSAKSQSGLVDLPEGYARPVGTIPGSKTSMSGYQLQAEHSYLFNDMPMDQFVQFVDPKNPDGYFGRLQQRAGMLGYNVGQAKQVISAAMQGQSSADKGMNTGINLFDVGSLAFEAVKVGSNVARVATKTGDSITAATLNAYNLSPKPNALKNTVLKGVPVEDSITDTLPTAYVSVADLAGQNAPVAVTQKLDMLDKIGDRLAALQIDKVLTPAEQQTAVLAMQESFAKPLGNLTIGDVRLVNNPHNSLTQVEAVISKQDGLGWGNQDAAQASMTSKGFTPESYQLYKSDDARWYAKITHTVDESKSINGVDLNEITKNPVVNWFQRNISHPTSYLPEELASMSSSATYTEGFIHEQIIKPLATQMNLGSKGKKTLNKVVEEARDQGKDLNVKQLSESWERNSGKPITDKEIVAYYAGKKLSNVIYHLANKSVYEDFARRGVKEISVDTATGFSFDSALATRKGRLGRVVTEDISDGRSIRAYDATTGRSYRIGDLSPDKIAEIKAKGHEIVKLEQPITVADDPHNYIIADRGDVKVKELNPIQLNYKPGTIGSQLYSGKWFVKQSVTKEFADGAGTYTMNPRTHAVGMTRKEMEKWANKWEAARQAYNDFKAGKISEQAANKAMEGTNQIETVAEFQTLLDEEHVVNSPFGVYFDREKPNTGAGAYDMTGEARPLDDYYQQNGRSIFSSRGERLSGPQDEAADVLNVYAALGKGVETVTKSGAYDAYREASVQRWFKTANEAGVLAERNPERAIMSENPYVANIDSGTKAQLELLRTPILRQLDSSTGPSEVWKASMRSIGEFVEGKTLLGKPVGDRLAAKAYDLMSSNPVSALRGWAFDAKLGLFNPGQLLIQSNQMFNALAIAPIKGAKAMAAMPMIRFAIANSTENIADYVARHPKLAAMHGMKPDEFKLYLSELKNSGISDVGGSVMYLDRWGNNLAYNKLQQGVSAVREYGRKAFFYEAERWNRITAHNIAWQEFAEQFPKADRTTSASRQWIKSRTDVLTNNMMSNNSAYWNKGILSYPTMFLSYHARLVSNILPEVLGGSKQLAGAEKARLAAGQALFYGTAGIPAAGWVYDHLNKATGREPTEAEYKAVTGGFFDAVLRNALNADSSISQRVGEGAALEDLWHQIATGDFADVVGGPTLSITGGMYDSLKSAALLLSAGKGDPVDVGEEAFLQVAKNISTFSNAFKAYWMNHANVYLSNTGKVIDARNYTTSEQVMQILSITPREVAVASDIYLQNQNVKQDRKAMIDLINGLQNKAIASGDPEVYKRNYQIIDSLLRYAVPDQNERAAFLREMNKGFAKDTQKNQLIRENFLLKGNTPLNKLERTIKEE